MELEKGFVEVRVYGKSLLKRFVHDIKSLKFVEGFLFIFYDGIQQFHEENLINSKCF